VQPPRRAAAERAREAKEQAARRRRTSIRIGAAGLFVLFASGVSVVLSPQNAAALIAVMAAGIVLLAVAFLLVRPKMLGLFENANE